MKNDDLRLDTVHAGMLPTCAANQIRTEGVVAGEVRRQSANDSVSIGSVWQQVPGLTQAFHPGIPNRTQG